MSPTKIALALAAGYTDRLRHYERADLTARLGMLEFARDAVREARSRIPA